MLASSVNSSTCLSFGISTVYEELALFSPHLILALISTPPRRFLTHNYLKEHHFRCHVHVQVDTSPLGRVLALCLVMQHRRIMRALPIDDSVDMANITRRGVTTNPAVMYTRFDGTTCGASCGTEFCTNTDPDATRIEFSAGYIIIDQFFGNCRFSMFAYSSHGRKIMEFPRPSYWKVLTQVNSESLE